jgi:hypothetical protein
LILSLVEVHSRSHFHEETLFLAVNYLTLDRFLSLRTVPVKMMQLVGITALNIAAKFEERYFLRLKVLSSLCKGLYEDKAFHTAETVMLEKLQYNLGWPGPLIFVRRINREVDEGDPKIRILTVGFTGGWPIKSILLF